MTNRCYSTRRADLWMCLDCHSHSLEPIQLGRKGWPMGPLHFTRFTEPNQLAFPLSNNGSGNPWAKQGAEPSSKKWPSLAMGLVIGNGLPSSSSHLARLQGSSSCRHGLGSEAPESKPMDIVWNHSMLPCFERSNKGRIAPFMTSGC